jgi:predicted TIM-barrel enzyme
MDHEAVHLGEGSLVEEDLDPLARGLLPGVVLAGDTVGAPGELGRLVAAPQLIEAIVQGHA